MITPDDMKEYFEYLDELKASNEVNMFGASIDLQNMFNLSRSRAIGILKGWMETFRKRKEAGEVKT